MPLNAYRHDAGSVMGHTFLEFTHTGRKAGRPYDAVAWCCTTARRPVRPSSLLHAGPRRTVRNLRAGPPSRCSWDVSFKPEPRFLGGEAFDVVVQPPRAPAPVRLTAIMGGATSATMPSPATSSAPTRSSRSGRWPLRHPERSHHERSDRACGAQSATPGHRLLVHLPQDARRAWSSSLVR
jgi:hypothetical protein